MKKQILFLLGSVLFLGISCTEKPSKREATALPKAVKTTVKATEKINNAPLKSESAIVAVATKIHKKATSAVATSVPAEIDNLRKKHEAYLNNSPYKKILELSKKERKAYLKGEI